MSADWGSSHYRRRVASELGLTVEALDRALHQLEAEEQAASDYQSRSHNDRLKAFANVLGVPLVRLAGVDGVSSLLPERHSAPKKRSSRPPAKKKPAPSRSTSSRPAAKRRKSTASKVPLKKYPWELDAPPPRPEPRPNRDPVIESCQACGLPFHPLTGACACT
ncbi:MAG: hypothetical protein HKN03_02660 [Acidimicrobiales bacterium]|nr:hypothetical protein [Acidimicrobiales bacterium]